MVVFRGRNTCKLVNTTNGQMYIRNVNFFTLAPTDSKTLFDDEESKENNIRKLLLIVVKFLVRQLINHQ